MYNYTSVTTSALCTCVLGPDCLLGKRGDIILWGEAMFLGMYIISMLYLWLKEVIISNGRDRDSSVTTVT